MYVLKLDQILLSIRTIDTAWHSNQKREVHTVQMSTLKTSKIYKQGHQFMLSS